MVNVQYMGHSNIKTRWFSGMLKNAERNSQRSDISALLFILLINNGRRFRNNNDLNIDLDKLYMSC